MISDAEGERRDLDRPERKRERIDQQCEQRHGRDEEDGDLGARGERDLGRELDLPARSDDDGPTVLRGVSDDRDDHRGDEELG